MRHCDPQPTAWGGLDWTFSVRRKGEIKIKFPEWSGWGKPGGTAACVWGKDNRDDRYFDRRSWFYLWWQNERIVGEGKFEWKAQGKVGCAQENFANRLNRRTQYFHRGNGKPMQICEWKRETCSLWGQTQKRTGSPRGGRKANEKK